MEGFTQILIFLNSNPLYKYDSHNATLIIFRHNLITVKLLSEVLITRQYNRDSLNTVYPAHIYNSNNYNNRNFNYMGEQQSCISIVRMCRLT